MKNGRFKFTAKFASGIFGGTIFGVIGFLIMLVIGGNYGCVSFINYVFEEGI